MFKILVDVRHINEVLPYDGSRVATDPLPRYKILRVRSRCTGPIYDFACATGWGSSDANENVLRRPGERYDSLLVRQRFGRNLHRDSLACRRRR